MLGELKKKKAQDELKPGDRVKIRGRSSYFTELLDGLEGEIQEVTDIDYKVKVAGLDWFVPFQDVSKISDE